MMGEVNAILLRALFLTRRGDDRPAFLAVFLHKCSANALASTRNPNDLIHISKDIHSDIEKNGIYLPPE
jgi:hypothetical protein